MANRNGTAEIDENASLRARVAQLEQRLADYEQFSGRLGEIAQAVTAATGGAFFHALVEGLAKSLASEHAMVGELSPTTSGRIEVLAMYSQGEHVVNFEYDLCGTPCENVMAGKLCVYPRGIQKLFPRDRQLVELGAESYIGTPLFDSAGLAIGLIVVIGGSALADAQRAEATLRIFAARAAAELERLRAEAALRESEGRLRRIFDSNMFGIQYWTSDGRTVDANDALLRLLGYSREDLRAGRVSWRNMTPPEYAHLDQRGLAEIREKGFCTPFEKEYFRKDGARVPVLLGAIQDDDPTRGMCFVIDLTRLKQAENELHQTSQMLHSLIQASPVAISMIDLDGNVKLWSPAAERTFGWSAAEALGRPPPMIPPEYADEFRRLREDVMRGRSLDGFETRRCRKDGSYIDVGVSAAPLRDAHGVLIGSMGLTRDITNRKAAEQALRESEQRFKAFMDNSPAVAFMKDAAGHYIYVNKTFCNRFDREFNAIVGGTDYDLFPAEIVLQLRENDAAVLSSGDALQILEAVPTPDGVLRHWLVYKFPVEDAAGRKFLGGVAIDITDQKQAEEALREARDELEQRVGERTASLVEANVRLQREIQERQAAEAALLAEQHLLRQLLDSQEADRKLIAYEIHDGLVQYVTGALMHLEAVALADQRPPRDLGEGFTLALRLLRDTIHEARRLISGLRPPILDESGIVQAVEYLIGESEGSQVIEFEHEVTFDRLSPLVEGALFRICQEALNNAAKHSRSKKVRVRLVQQGAWVRMVVSDEGVGFDPPQVTEKMFGLQGIRERARLLGGHASIDSAPGRGTRVTVDIPLSPSG